MVTFLIGFLSWNLAVVFNPLFLTLALLAYYFFLKAKSRKEAFSLHGGYFLGSTLMLFLSTLGHKTSSLFLLTLWLGVGVLHGVTGAIFFGNSSSKKALGIIAITFLQFVSFLGDYTITSPLIGLGALAGVSELQSNFKALNTQIPALKVNSPVSSFLVNQELKKQIQKEARTKILVLPEFVGGEFHPGFIDFWRPTRRKVLIGVKEQVRDLKFNSVALIGEGRPFILYRQRTPIPQVMSDYSRGKKTRIVEIAGKRVALFLCYEILSLSSFLEVLFNPPEALVALSFTRWERGSVIRKTQKLVLEIWGRFLGIPVVVAQNY